MRHYALALAIVLAGCGKEEPKPAPNAGASGKFATPDATIKTLVAACKAKKKEDVAACFAKDAEGEFQKLRKLEIPEGEWVEVFGDLGAFEVVKVNQADKSSSTATVEVTFKSKKEEIHMVKEGNDWKIQGF